MFEPILTIKDFILGPIFIFFLLSFAYWWKGYKYAHSPLKQYYMPALYARIIGALSHAAIYQYYYKGGDTFRYFAGASGWYDFFLQQPLIAIKQLFYNTPIQYQYVIPHLELKLGNNDVLYLQKLGGVISLFSFNTYIVISLIFSFFSFLGCWKLFKALCIQYPQLINQLAIPILFIPSVFFWGTGFMKDPLVLGSLGYLYYNLILLVKKQNNPLLRILAIIFHSYIIFTFKAYILFAFFPAALIWFFWLFRTQIKSSLIRQVITPLVLILAVSFGYIGLFFLGTQNKAYALDNILDKATVTQNYIYRISIEQGGSAYDIGKLDGTLLGTFTLFPQAVNVTLFRPYLWEARNPVVLLAAIESSIALLISLYLIYKAGIVVFFKRIFNSPTILFCLTFSIIFAFAVGISSGNFGALARYKIPALPFYFSALVLISNMKNKY